MCFLWPNLQNHPTSVHKIADLRPTFGDLCPKICVFEGIFLPSWDKLVFLCCTLINYIWAYNKRCNTDSPLSLWEELDPPKAHNDGQSESHWGKRNFLFWTSRGNLCPNLHFWCPEICTFEGDFEQFPGHQTSGASWSLAAHSLGSSFMEPWAVAFCGWCCFNFALYTVNSPIPHTFLSLGLCTVHIMGMAIQLMGSIRALPPVNHTV